MARIISGAVLAVWGVAILISALVGETEGAGAYATGQKLAFVFAAGLVLLGARAIVKDRPEARR